MNDEALRNYVTVLSFLLAALSFLSAERREAVVRLHSRGDVSRPEKWLAVMSVVLLLIAALGLVISAYPAVRNTGLDLGDLVRLATVVKQAFVAGWMLLIAVTCALLALVIRALKIEVADH